MNWYKHIPMQRKILAACLVVILVPLTILVSLILRRSMDEEIDRSTVNMTQANEMIDDRLETIVNHLKTTSAMYLVYPDIIQFVKYSLQGTTQGNGLAGGETPVRFSM